MNSAFTNVKKKITCEKQNFKKKLFNKRIEEHNRVGKEFLNKVYKGQAIKERINIFMYIKMMILFTS